MATWYWHAVVEDGEVIRVHGPTAEDMAAVISKALFDIYLYDIVTIRIDFPDVVLPEMRVGVTMASAGRLAGEEE